MQGVEAAGYGVEGRWFPDRRFFDLLSITPVERPDVRLARALVRAGSAVAVDCGRDEAAWPALFAEFERGGLRGAGVRIPDGVDFGALRLPAEVGFLIVSGDDAGALPAAWRAVPVIAQVCSVEEAERALDAGVQGLIAKGAESGGRVGAESAFVLLQRILALPSAADLPVWCQGGIGLHTAAGMIAAGAYGVVLDTVLAAMPESSLPDDVKAQVLAMDGSEVRALGGYQVYARDLAGTDPDRLSDGTAVRAALAAGDVLPLGQDAGLTKHVLAACPTVEALILGIRMRLAGQLRQARSLRPLDEGSPWAVAHGTRYPVAQGPMTRVSDNAAFCAAVAEGGGLPFLALSRMRPDACRTLLEETRNLLGERPWGVGVLGFAPAETLSPQLELIKEFRPSAVILAGGRPSQARPLTELGIPTYLHVPSPGLLDLFVKDGARHFIFEGRECGGHIGPRFSLVLWEQAISTLLEVEDPENLHILFAGGIHDARSGAAVAAMAAPLAALGAKIGVLMGSAYIATAEAVACGALTDGFQERVLAGRGTVVVETSPGHAIRCLPSAFIDRFDRTRDELIASGVPPKEVWAKLEAMTTGRLRIASKGIERQGSALVSVDRARQEAEGMYMVGQVVALLDAVTTIAELHAAVTTGALAHLDRVSPPVYAGDRPEPIAIVGMACTFAGAPDLETYWANILDGRDRFREVTDDVWRTSQYFRPDSREPGQTYSKWAGFVDPVPFDPVEYGIPPQSIPEIDVSQLIALEMAKRALEDAGYGERFLDRGRTSVIFGADAGSALGNAIRFRNLFPQYCGDMPPELDRVLPRPSEDSFPGILANVVTGRIANRLGLGGVNYVIGAACASSLSAVEHAIKELRYGTSDVVLAGGVDLRNGIHDFLLFSAIGALSPTGRCVPFDESADGFVMGEGVGVVVLKRLGDAERDGDRIYAVIEGVAGSSDGKGMGLTAPRKEGQKRALERAYAQAGVLPGDVGLVEAHGTGTVVGDRTELQTLTEVFNAGGALPGSIALGAVKSQIGHTKCAAGIAGLIKVAMALHHRVLPPAAHVQAPNRGYRPGTSPFVLPSAAEPWLGGREHGAVSAYGFGGTNFHAVLGAYAPHRPAFGARTLPAELFAFRGETYADAERSMRRMVEYLERATAPVSLAALAYAAWRSGTGPVQCAFTASTRESLEARLRAAIGRVEAAELHYRPSTPDHKVAWLYPGQGSQYPGMLRELFVYFPALRELLEENPDCASAIFPPTVFGEEERRAQRRRLTDTQVAQPALGIVESALSTWLKSLGLRPDMAGGHSFGEFAALSAAGAIDPRDLIALARKRARAIIEAAPPDPGAMVAVAADAAMVLRELEAFPAVVAANLNSPEQTVISGPTDDVMRALEHLKSLGIMVKRIETACAFHSPVVAGAEAETNRQLAAIPMASPEWPVYSNVTAAPHGTEPAEILGTLERHLVSPVRFTETVEAMYGAGARTFVEIGPRRVLSGLAHRILADRPCRIVAFDPGDRGLAGMLDAVAQLSVLADGFDAEPLFAGRTRPADLDEPPALPATAWLVDGHRARPLRARTGAEDPGAVLASGPVVRVGAGDGRGEGAASGASSAQDAILQYLANMRELVQAQRDVLVSYYGGGAAAMPAVRPAAPERGLDGAGAPTRTSDSGRRTGVSVDRAPEGEAVPAAAMASSPRTRATGPDHREVLFTIVSERTGYPVELLDPDLDLEADLSIDSIKRQEIIAELSQRLALREVAGRDADALIEELASRRTLNSLLVWLEEHLPSSNGGDAGVDATPTADGGGADVRPVAELLLEIVSETTGYPADVLDPDLDLEADLSIDSIKRLEIVSRLAGHPAVQAVGTDPDALVEHLSTLKTLRAIVDWLEAAAPRQAEESGPSQVPLSRYVVRDVPTPAPSAPADLTGHVFLLTDDGRGIAGALADRLRRRGAEARVIDFATFDPAAVSGAGTPAVDGVVHLRPLHREYRTSDIKRFFPLAQKLLAAGCRYLVTTGAAHADDAVEAGTPRGLGFIGLAQAAASEFPRCRSCHIELDLAAGAEENARRIESELGGAPDELVIGYRGGERVVRRPAAAPPRPVAAGRLSLGKDSVVLFTGGARGVTAHLAVRLAERYGCHLEITGRSPEPTGEESPVTRGLTDPRQLRQALVATAGAAGPGEIERLVRRTLADREIRETLSRIRAAGASVRYTQLDVRDEAALADFIADRYEALGRIDGVVHGAGVVEPMLIPAKTAESFERVFDTKVNAALTLYRHIRDDVSFVVFFSSIASMITNPGQVDYSAANSALDRLAAAWQARIPGRVLSVNWGPWDGTGMVGDALARSYAAKGIGLIPLDGGADALLDELAAGAGDPQVALVCASLEALSRSRGVGAST